MSTLASVEVRISDESSVGEARRAARRMARALGLDEVEVEQVAIVTAEAGRNVAVHGGGGQVVLTPAGEGALDVLALDRGPGIPDVARAVADGYSTGGTAGQGLGAIARLASRFDLYSAPGLGSAVLARMGPAPLPDERLEVGALCVPVKGEQECGDAWAVARPGGRPVVLVADGLGHGHHAAQAARGAVAAFEQHAELPAGRLVEALHQALRATRGAAVAVCEVTGDGRAVRYAAIGNIAGALAGSGHVRKMASLPGTAGHEARSARAFDYDWPDDALLVVHSDGVATHWDLSGYPGLAQRHPALVAGVLYRDFARGRDDATVVAARWRPA